MRHILSVNSAVDLGGENILRSPGSQQLEKASFTVIFRTANFPIPSPKGFLSHLSTGFRYGHELDSPAGRGSPVLAAAGYDEDWNSGCSRSSLNGSYQWSDQARNGQA
jgi:hypothetical protein